jgi:erythromycin esterase-like protein
MAREGQVNLGGLARQKWGSDQVALLGFGTYEGKVIASHAWDGPIEKMTISPGKPGSFEAAFHSYSVSQNQDKFFISFRDQKLKESAFSDPRGHRAIGVVYHPAYEHFGNYVSTSLYQCYDAFLFVDKTTAIEPIIQPFEEQEIPETWPRGQ